MVDVVLNEVQPVFRQRAIRVKKQHPVVGGQSGAASELSASGGLAHCDIGTRICGEVETIIL